LSTADFLLDFHQVQKESGRDKSTGLFPELTLKELVFLHHEYYSIFDSVASTMKPQFNC
jgi:hypothetical protein